MTERAKKRRKKTPTIAVIIALIIAIVMAIQQSQQQGPSMVPTVTGVVTLPPRVTSTAALTDSVSDTPALVVTETTVPNTLSPTGTDMPLETRKPVSTVDPDLQITPMSGTLYEVVRSVDVLGCPDSRCKVIDTYKKGTIIVVTGTVNGTIYKEKKTRVWYQVLFHDGRNVYVHGAYAAPHEIRFIIQ
jgi:hypothetical protein